MRELIPKIALRKPKHSSVIVSTATGEPIQHEKTLLGPPPPRWTHLPDKPSPLSLYTNIDISKTTSHSSKATACCRAYGKAVIWRHEDCLPCATQVARGKAVSLARMTFCRLEIWKEYRSTFYLRNDILRCSPKATYQSSLQHSKEIEN